MTLIEDFSSAQNRKQPYINLVNQIYTIDELFSADSLKTYKQQDIKSLYLRVDKLVLNNKLGKKIAELTAIGIREILIFCDKNSSLLDITQVQDFLKSNNIIIIFRVAQLTKQDLESIKIDAMGKNDLLGFKEIHIDKIVYDSGHQVSLLHNTYSDQIILTNDINHKIEIANKNPLSLTEPDYIKNVKNSETDDFSKKDIELEVTVDVDIEVEHEHQFEFDFELEEDIEEDKDLSLDDGQLNNKFNRRDARLEVYSRLQIIFREEHLLSNHDKFSINIYSFSEEIIDKLFDSDPRINYITGKALDLVLKYDDSFEQGIDTNNLPIGLAFNSKGIIFASDQRLNSMPINSYTVKFDGVKAPIKEILTYSWLPFATKASLSLNDIYIKNSHLKPHALAIPGRDKHPNIDYWLRDNGLDIPSNQYYSEYNVIKGYSSGYYYPIYTSYSNLGMQKYNNQDKFTSLENFPGLKFYNLSQQDIYRLNVIANGLKERQILNIFIEIVKGKTYGQDASHLLNDKAALFLRKLFYEIFPLPINQEKLAFFTKVLGSGNYKKQDNNIEDKFEAMHALYVSIKEFIKKQEIDGTIAVQVINKVAQIVIDQTKYNQNLKIMLGRLVQILEFTASMGGNLNEQLLYLEKNSILAEPLYYVKTKKFDLTVIHQQAALTNNLDNENNPLTASELIKQLDIPIATSFFSFGGSNEKFPGYVAYITGIRYISSIAPHQRASVDTYPKYFYKLEADDRCFPRASSGANKEIERFKTSEYIVSDVLNSISTHESTKNRLIDSAPKNLDQLNRLLNYEKQVKSTDQCYAEISVIGKTADLVKNFTNKQAMENVRLLVLNMVSSSGKYYNALYPDQEFDSYISLFSVLFSKVKIYQNEKIGENHYTAGKNYNTDSTYIGELTSLSSVSSFINTQETEHKKMINYFVDISKNHPEFNFSQIVALGLIANLKNSLLNQAIESAKILLQYNEHFTQVLRILLSTSTSTNKKDFDELSLRTEAMAHTINVLARMHQSVTQNGKHPENLEFFAACFDSKYVVTDNMVKDLQTKLSKLDITLKQELLESFANSKLAYDGGKIIDSKFPVITLKLLDSPSKLAQLTSKAKDFAVSYVEATRFNIIGMDSKMSAKINLLPLQIKYKLNLPEKLHSLNYKRIVTKIDESEDFIKVTLLHNKASKEVIQNLSLDLLKILFENIADHTAGYKEEAAKIAELLFNKDQTLTEQLKSIHASKQLIEKLLKKCGDHYEKERFLDLLSAKPSIPYDKLYPTLVYLNSINDSALKAKGYDLNKLLKAAGNKLITEHFKEFKAVTNAFLKHDLKINLRQLYQVIKQITKANFDNTNLAKIISYCLKHSDFYIVDILAKLDGKANNIDKLLSWITKIEPTELKKLSSHADLNDLLAIKDLTKIQVISDIVLKFNGSLNKSQYKAIVKHIIKHDLDYAYLLKSYLYAPSHPSLTDEVKNQIIFENIGSLEKAQIIFSEYNLERFNYDEHHVITKIRAIVYKNLDKTLAVEKQNEFYQYFLRIVAMSKHYSTYTNTQMHEEAMGLKHARMLAKDESLDEIRDIDLDYIGLSLEMMYRETGMFPRDTQIISLILSATHDKNLIQEIATGQGKSLITAIHAAYLSYTGQTVDVATSSEYLAQQAIKQFSTFYRNLGIEHSEEILTPGSEISQYKKHGVNIGVASSLALFKANRDFHKNTMDLELSTDVSLICDEVDFIMTSEVNYKLAMPLIRTTQEETRILFEYILKFSNEAKLSDIKSFGLDGVKNLILYLHHQFAKYNLVYQYPLNALQLNELKTNKNQEVKNLYDLHNALTKCEKNIENIFDKLLTGMKAAERLELGVDYVVNFNDPHNLLKAIPIIKDQPSPETVFGDGAQTFLHILIEKQFPEYKFRFDTSAPTATIFNISPKVFFDNYIISGGRVIGLTGTAGNAAELEEFRITNKMVAFFIPMFEEDKKIIKIETVLNAKAQYQRLLDILAQKTADRPVIIFCQSTKEAEQLYFKLSKQKPNVKLYAASQHDSGTIHKIVDEASSKGRITVTAPLLSRGTDFIISGSEEGFLAIGFNDRVHLRGFIQQYGRVGRNGNPGEYIAIFNKEIVGIDVDAHMEKISEQEKILRAESQPYTDILQPFNVINQDQEANAIIAIDAIKKIWKKLQKENNGKKTPIELGKDLLKEVKKKYPLASKQLEDYLAKITKDVPKKEAVHELSVKPTYKASYVVQHHIESAYTPQKYPSAWSQIDQLARSISNMDRSNYVDPNNIAQKAFYSGFYQAQNIIMTTHAFDIKDHVFSLSNIFHYELQSSKSMKSIVLTEAQHIGSGDSLSSIKISILKGKLSCQYKTEKPVEIKINDIIGQQLYNKILTTLQESSSNNLELNSKDLAALDEFFISRDPLLSHKIDGEGAIGNLMLNEFKKSFQAYQNAVMSKEVDQIANLIESFVSIKDIDLTKLEYGKYQAISITTKFTSESNHAESIMTDGKFLFWVNRGGGSEDNQSGIKIFKVIKDMSSIATVLRGLKVAQSRTDTLKAIYSLLREESDITEPNHVLISMSPQAVGNCAWVQSKGMLKVAALVGKLSKFDELPDVTSQEWQKALKDSSEIYKDFTTYDRIVRTEAILFSVNKEFVPQFLNLAEQAEINERRELFNPSISHELLQRLASKLESTQFKYENNRYEQAYHKILDSLMLEVAIDSPFGKALQQIEDRESVMDLLDSYQQNEANDFVQLDQIYNGLENSVHKQDAFKLVLDYIVHEEYNITNLDHFIEQVKTYDQSCAREEYQGCMKSMLSGMSDQHEG